jgi:hypothetical protein
MQQSNKYLNKSLIPVSLDLGEALKVVGGDQFKGVHYEYISTAILIQYL